MVGVVSIVHVSLAEVTVLVGVTTVVGLTIVGCVVTVVGLSVVGGDVI